MEYLSKILICVLMSLSLIDALHSQERQRVRNLGITPWILSTGLLNAITGVDGVMVRHQTLNDGVSTRTGVTAILPHSGNLFR